MIASRRGGAEGRARRGLALIGLSTAVLLGAGALYLHHGLPASTAAPPGPAPAYAAAFADPEAGVVAALPAGGRVRTLFVTRDGGRTWRRAATGAATAGFQLLDRDHVAWIDPGDPWGLYTSSDGGGSWLRRGLPFQAGTAPAVPLFLDPAGALLLAAGAGAAPSRPRLFETRDGGATWQALAAAGLPAGAFARLAAFSSLREGFVVEEGGSWPGVFRTVDGGRDFEPVPIPGPPYEGARTGGVRLLRSGGLLLLVVGVEPPPEMRGPGVPSLVLYTSLSEDGGLTWSELAAGPEVAGGPGGGLPELPLSDDDRRLLVMQGGRLLVRLPAAAKWSDQALHLPGRTRATRLLAAAPGALFALGSGPRGEPLLLRSRDGGSAWEVTALPRP